jgi:hypothetical protein
MFLRYKLSQFWSAVQEELIPQLTDDPEGHT